MVLKSSLEKIFNEIFIKEYRLGSRKTDFDCYSLSDAKQEIGIYDVTEAFILFVIVILNLVRSLLTLSG